MTMETHADKYNFNQLKLSNNAALQTCTDNIPNSERLYFMLDKCSLYSSDVRGCRKFKNMQYFLCKTAGGMK
jgi:hypothetical protein